MSNTTAIDIKTFMATLNTSPISVGKYANAMFASYEAKRFIALLTYNSNICIDAAKKEDK